VAGDVDALLPRTTRERRWYTAVAVTAGVCEEVLYRGVVLVVATLLLPAVPLWALALGVAAVFGAAHLYQGPAGVAATTTLGAVLGLIVVTTGSLLPAMALHALVDLRVLLLRPPQR
jgi:membrane protease YdiL (CAAX protease family)